MNYKGPTFPPFVRGVIGDFPSQRVSDADSVPMTWRHHGKGGTVHFDYNQAVQVPDSI